MLLFLIKCEIIKKQFSAVSNFIIDFPVIFILKVILVLKKKAIQVHSLSPLNNFWCMIFTVLFFLYVRWKSASLRVLLDAVSTLNIRKDLIHIVVSYVTGLGIPDGKS